MERVGRVEGGVVSPPSQRALPVHEDVKGPHERPEDGAYVTCLWLAKSNHSSHCCSERLQRERERERG